MKRFLWLMLILLSGVSNVFGFTPEQDSITAPSSSSSNASQPDNPVLYKLLIKIPTRDRAEQFFRRLKLYCRFLSGEIDVTFLITCDNNDRTMNNPEVIKALEHYNTVAPYIHLYYYFGDNKSKIDAYNVDIDKHMNFDVLLVASDDMEPVMQGYDKIIIDRMLESFPDWDGVLNFFDGHQGAQLNTMPVIGKKYYERFGYIYHPEYLSFWCDNEFTEISKIVGKEKICDEMIIKHFHPYWGTAKTDASYIRNNAFGPRDQKIYMQRQAQNFDLDVLYKKWDEEQSKANESNLAPQEQHIFNNQTNENTNEINGQNTIKWSILIPTLVERRHLFKRIYQKLVEQINALNLQNVIEIVVYEDNRECPVGYKRNRLLEQSKGEYICFLDDDDDVSDDYIPLIYEKLLTNPDCVALEGIITFDGRNPRRFTHSIRYTDWFEKRGVYYRPPNHLNPIKRSIAIQFKFPDIRFGEDRAWSMAIAKSGLLNVEASVEKPYYFYLFKSRKK